MKRAFLALAFGLFCACSSAKGTPSPQTTAPAMTNPDLDLSWSLGKTPDGKRLRIEYRLKNKTTQKLYIADQLLSYHEGTIKRVPTRMIVSSDRLPGTVLFSRAIVETPTTQFDHPPGATALEPGATHQGSAELDLPLRGWHNYTTPPALPDKPKSAVLEVAYLTGAIEWGAVTTGEGENVTVPQLPSYYKAAKLARFDVRPLP